MKERAFIDAVHRVLPKDIHRQSMTLGSQSFAGTPDYYYDWMLDLWVEYKVLRKDDHFPRVLPEDALPSELQRQWLGRRFAAGGNAVVAVGLKIKGRAHGFLLETPDEWSTRHPMEWYKSRIMPVQELAQRFILRLSVL